MIRNLVVLILTTWFSVSFISCKKDKFLTDPDDTVSFSQDSILFDTVFTSIGSTTKNIRVINKNNQKINISSIYLEKGQSSSFFLNVDGTPGKEVHDVEILANDSIYIFVQVNVDPTNQNSPLIIQDKILFNVNGNIQSVPLEAWGQDAYYHFPTDAIQYKDGYFPFSYVASGNNVTATWNNDKPHVIYGWLVVDSTQKLIINQGVRVYFHQNAGLWVYRYGTLQVNGMVGNEVTFMGDRREADYADLPGQWDRIWINEGSVDNYINYAIIKNGYIGIQASLLFSYAPNKLKLTNTIIQNCSKMGIYSLAFHIWGANNVVANCKEYCGAFTLGGSYTFIHTTFANYFNQDGGRGGQPCVHVDNYDGTDIWPLDSMYFANSIIEGSQGSELEISISQSTVAAQMSKFTNCLLRSSSITNTLVTSTANVFNGNADFESTSGYNFKIKATSSATNIADPAVIGTYPFLSQDIKGSSRMPNPDAGAYQH